MITKTQIEKLYKNYFDYYKNISEANKSFPFFFNFDNHFYDEKKETILVYWQETFWYPSKHWVSKTTKNSLYFGTSCLFDDCIELNFLCYKLFDFPNLANIDKSVQKHFISPFWKFLKQLRDKYPQKDYNLVWSNIIKFDINWKRIEDDIIKKLWINFITEHKNILTEEIKIINPKKIIILWKQKDKNTIYNKIILETFTSSPANIIINNYVNKDTLNNIYHISHPNYLIREKQTFKDIINKII